jgi:hypothetical protein
MFVLATDNQGFGGPPNFGEGGKDRARSDAARQVTARARKFRSLVTGPGAEPQLVGHDEGLKYRFELGTS